MLVGWIRTWLLLRQPLFRSAFNEVAAEIVHQYDGHPRRRVFVVMIGFSKSGKSTLVHRHPVLREFAQIETNDLHSRLNRRFAVLRDDMTIRGKSYWLRQMLTRRLRVLVLRRLLMRGVDVVVDACNLDRMRRLALLDAARAFNYQTIEIWVTCRADVLHRRLADADFQKTRSTPPQKPTWVALGQQQRRHFDRPIRGEASHLLIYSSPDDPAEQLHIPI